MLAEKNTYSLIESTTKILLNGGAFGFEGSILSVFSMIILILIELYYRKKN
jgi:hypothetical protein